MQARWTLAPGQKGTKRFLERYDEQRHKRLTTIEIIVEESGWFPPEKPAIVWFAR